MSVVIFIKSLVSGYTRRDGTVVKPHSDRRTKRQQAAPSQLPLFDDGKKLPPNRFKGADPVKATPDMFGDAHHEINSMHSQMRAADEFSDKYLELSHQRSAALDKHVSAMLGRGEMAVFDMKDGKAAALHSSSKKDGGVQVTHYGKGGIMGDTQYDDVAAAIEGEDLWNYPLMYSDEADKVLGGSLSAEAKFQDKKAKTAAKTDTPAFKKWFGNSKVVDAEGKPLVVYHGTAADFDAFDNSKTGANDLGLWGRGHYFASSPTSANSYALRQGDGARVVPAYVSIQNPLVLRTGSDLVTRLPDGTNTRELIGHNLDGSKIKAIAMDGGHDGVIQIKPDGSIGDVVAFNPTQIKSATGNNGDYSSHPDITKAILFLKAKP